MTGVEDDLDRIEERLNQLPALTEENAEMRVRSGVELFDKLETGRDYLIEINDRILALTKRLLVEIFDVDPDDPKTNATLADHRLVRVKEHHG